jgi:hypothetical protein
VIRATRPSIPCSAAFDELLTVRDRLSPDAMVASEDELIETLPNSAKVDGHEVGSGEVNIFISTTKPQNTFKKGAPGMSVSRTDSCAGYFIA